MTNKFSFDPLSDLKNYREALSKLLEGGWVLPRDLMPSGINAIVIAVDVIDNGPDIIIKANLPGAKPNDVSISILGDTLTIKATTNEDDDDDLRGATYLRYERRANTYVRSLRLPMPVIAHMVDARFKNGVLTLSLPKSDRIRPRVITVSTE